MRTTEQPLRLGLIGTGLAVEKLHWPALRQLPDRYVIAGFADGSEANARHFASYSGVDMAGYCSDYRDLLARPDIDAVLVCLPIPLLYPVAREALTAGKDVLSEKSTGVDEDEALAFCKLADEFPERTILVAENIFYRDDVRFARTLIDSGAIGQPHLMSWRVAGQLVPRDGTFSGTPWRYRPQYRGGVHLDAGVHNIAQIRMLCGEAIRVHGIAQQTNSTIDAPNTLVLNLEFATEVIGNLTACYSEIPLPPEPGDMRVYGSAGVLIMDGARGERRVTVSGSDGATETYAFRGIDNGYYAELRNFYDAVRHGEPVVGTIAESAQNMMVILRGLDSAEQGAALPVEPVPGVSSRIPVWRPYGSTGLFDTMPGEHPVNLPVG